VVTLLLLVTIGIGDGLLGALAQESARAPISAQATVQAGRPARARVFVLLVDSLRYLTAVDAGVMPNLVALGRQGVVAQVTTTNNAVTGPAVRAAFVGEERVALFDFSTSFIKRRDHVPSLFTDLAVEGRTAVAYSDGFFRMFGDDVVERPNRGTESAQSQDACARAAQRAFLEGSDAFVLMHLVYGDYAAHQVGVGSAAYRSTFGQIDTLIGQLAAQVSADDTFVVFGDHGHDEVGRHLLGVPAPTFALFRGPRFRPGIDLGTVHITEHRYLLSWALGLPLSGAYRGGRHPEALVAREPTLGTYAAVEGPPPAPVWRWRPDRWAALLVLAALLGAGLVVLDGLLEPQGALRAAPRRLALGALAGMGALLWGAVLSAFDVFARTPGFSAIGWAWLGVGLGVLVLGWRRSPWALVVLGVLGCMLPPTIHRHGAAASMAPLWFCGALALAAAARSGWGALAVAALVVLLFPFKLAIAAKYNFIGWFSWPLHLIPGEWATLDALGLGLVLLRRQRPMAMVLACLMLGFVYELHTREVLLGRNEAVVAVLIAGLAVPLRLVLWRRGRADEPAADVPFIAAVERTLWLGAALVAFHATVAGREQVYAWFSLLLGAVTVTAWLLERAPLSLARWGFAGVGALATLAAGWVSLSWTVYRLEWGFLYDWTDAATVEHHVGWFLPMILLRYALFGLCARRLLFEGAPGVALRAGRDLGRLITVRAASLVLITLGIGLWEDKTSHYLESALETGMWLVSMPGLF
jgi:hypothetical protein